MRSVDCCPFWVSSSSSSRMRRRKRGSSRHRPTTCTGAAIGVFKMMFAQPSNARCGDITFYPSHRKCTVCIPHICPPCHFEELFALHTSAQGSAHPHRVYLAYNTRPAPAAAPTKPTSKPNIPPCANSALLPALELVVVEPDDPEADPEADPEPDVDARELVDLGVVPEPVPDAVICERAEETLASTEDALERAEEAAAPVEDPKAEFALTAAHSADWRAWAAARSAVVQFVVRHVRAAPWKGVEEQMQVRSV